MAKHAFVLLDATGSMAGEEQRVVSTLNEFVSTLGGKTHLYVYMFDSERWVEHFAGRKRNWQSMKTEEYQPGAMTPLYDAIGKTVTKAMQFAAPKDKVAVIIDTDSLENASKEWSSERVHALIDTCKARGWEFHFNASGIDENTARAVGATGQSMGVQHVNSGGYAGRRERWSATTTKVSTYFNG